MTQTDFERDMQDYLKLVNSKSDLSYADYITKQQELRERVNLPYMNQLIDCVGWFSDTDKQTNEAIIREFESLFEFAFDPPQMNVKDFNFDDPWIREFQHRYLNYFERYYPDHRDIVQKLIDIVCKRNYQIWEYREKRRSK